VRPTPATTPSAEPAPAEPTTRELPGTLAEETRLMSLALAAERRGSHSRARELYLRIVRDYPSSPLAPEARSGLLRVK
jgi:TolA-binding protein